MTARTEDLDMVHRRGGAQRRPQLAKPEAAQGASARQESFWLILKVTGHWVSRWRKSEGRGTTQQRQHVRPTEHRSKTASYLIQLKQSNREELGLHSQFSLGQIIHPCTHSVNTVNASQEVFQGYLKEMTRSENHLNMRFLLQSGLGSNFLPDPKLSASIALPPKSSCG